MKCRFLSFVAAALLAGPIATQAAPVTYLESLSGDLSGGGSLTTLSLGVGVNTVQGRFGRTSPTSGPDFDSFAFIVQAGSEVVAATVTLADADGDIIESSWFLRSGSAVGGGGAEVQFFKPSSPGSDSLLGGPLAAGTYNFSHNAFESTGSAPYLSDYTFSLTVRPLATVPEPASFALVGLALVGAGVARRKFAA